MVIDTRHPAAASIVVRDPDNCDAVVGFVVKIDTDKGTLERLEYGREDAPRIVEPLSYYDVWIKLEDADLLQWNISGRTDRWKDADGVLPGQMPLLGVQA